MKLQLVVLASGLGIAATMLAAGPAAARADVDCPDFSSQNQAQAVYDQDPTDPNRLDEDGDGIACEDLPSGTNATNFSAPQGGVETGSGGTAVLEAEPLFLLGGLAFAGACGIAVYRRFRTQRT